MYKELRKYKKIFNFSLQEMLKMMRMLNYSLFSYLHDNYFKNE
jgi:hypothetical protein